MMFKAFHAMGLNPHGSTEEELDKWITNYNIKKEQKPTVGHSLTLPTTTDDAAVRPKIKHQQATAICSYPPKVRVFSGGDNKIETPYDIWRYDVQMALMDPSYTKEQKEFAIRRSLTGSAARPLSSSISCLSDSGVSDITFTIFGLDFFGWWSFSNCLNATLSWLKSFIISCLCPLMSLSSCRRPLHNIA
jgi:hypothetical protein